MPLLRQTSPAKRHDDAESPFWISFADQMTALMVLFLVALTVAMFAVTEEVAKVEQQEDTRQEEISSFMLRVKQLAESHPGVSLRGTAIDFGERARFDSNSHKLGESQARLLRNFAPEILALARDPLGSRWLKRISVVGFADASGNYLHNLNLSLQRSERVLCVLLIPPSGVPALSDEERQQVRQLFIVSGASFNDLKNSPEASRRIELRLEFYEADEAPQPPAPITLTDNRCPLDT
jgi:flagellar motor protein MotB